MKILIIEDDQVLANIYRNKFTQDGFQAEVAGDGVAGLEMVSKFRPDVILLDLILPKLTGIELMKKIRSEPDFKELPVIVFSNTYLTNMVQDAWKAGATKCLSKANCTPKNVIEAVRAALKNNGAPAPELATPAKQPAAAPKAAAAPAVKPAGKDAEDAQFQDQLRTEFVAGLPATLNALRTSLQGVVKAENDTIRLKQINELYRRIHALTGNAGIAGALQIAQMADALEALLKELYEKPKNINTSTLRTVASTIDLLALMFEKVGTPEKELPTASILVVDDEAISRRAITYALEKAKLKSVNVEDPLHAFQLLADKKFDLVFLDVDMPNMNGFELCSRLRSLPAHKRTPVVFVTSLTDLESRVNSTMSGGNDFIAKPFLFIELTVKALSHVVRGRLQPA